MHTARLLIAAVLLVSTLGVAAHPSQENAPAVEPSASIRTLLIVHADHLKEVAVQWAEYRFTPIGGEWNVVLHEVEANTDPQSKRLTIQQLIRSTYRSAVSRAPGDFAVLLLGDADSAADGGKGGAIPAWYFPQTDSVLRSRDGTNDEFATDHPYQIIDDGKFSPQIALGRVPAHTPEQARIALEKIKRYEAAPTLESLERGDRNRITYVASQGRFGMMDGVLENLFKMMIDRLVPHEFDLTLLYANASSIYCPPPSRLTETVLERMHEGALLFNYLGHGHPTGLDNLYWRNRPYPMLTVKDLESYRRPNVQKSKASGASDHAGLHPDDNDLDVSTFGRLHAALLPIAFMSCCSVGWYDLPKNERSLAEAMLFHSDGGAIAVIAGSRITHPYPNTVLQMNISQALLVDRVATVGELDLQATRNTLRTNGTLDRQIDMLAGPIARMGKWETSLGDLRKMHVKMYNLIGDPATRIAHTQSQISNLKFENGVLSGEVPGMKQGRVIVTLETARDSMAAPHKVQHPIGEHDPDLETKAANNYTLVNDRVLARFEGEVRDGRFELPADVPAAAVPGVRVSATGVCDAGSPRVGTGALRMVTESSHTSSPPKTKSPVQ